MVVKWFKGKHSIIFSWWMSYALILLIPILISGFIYFEANKIIQERIIKSNELILKMAQQRMDNMLINTERLSREICLDYDIREIINSMGVNDDAFRYSIYKIHNRIKQYSLTNDRIKNVYIYFKDKDSILTSSTTTTSRDFCEQFYKNTEMDYDKWKSLINRKYNGEYIFVGRSNNNSNVFENILYIRSIPLNNQNDIVNMVISFDEKSFMEETGGLALINGRGLYLIDSQNNMLNLSKDGFNHSAPLLYDAFKGREGAFYSKIQDEQIAVSYVSSEINLWKYVSVVPYKIYWNQAEYINTLILISIILCIVFGGIVSFILLKRNYRPIGDLVRIFQEQADLTCEETNNEYSYLKEAANKVIEDKKSINKRVEEQNKTLRDVFLARLIKGYERGNSYFEDLIKNYGIEPKSNFFAVAVFYIKNLKGFNKLNEQIDVGSCFEMIRLVTSDAIEKLINNNCVGYAFEVDELMVCLFSFKSNEINDSNKEIERVVLGIQDFLKNQYDIELTIGVSNLLEAATAIPKAYTEALEVLDYKRFTGNKEIIYYREIEYTQKTGYYYPIEKEYQLLNCFKIGDFEGVKDILGDLFQVNFGKDMLPIQVVRCLMFDMVSTMIKAIDIISNIYGNKFIEKLNPVEVLLKCESVPAMKECMFEIAREVCEYVKDNNEKVDFSLRDKVFEYVENNYGDSNLSNTSVADYLGMNPNYVSDAFKMQHGTGLKDYIDMMRVDRAKELMKSSRKNIEEIAMAVGYSNTRTFTRVFKKYEGMTPGKYSEMLHVK